MGDMADWQQEQFGRYDDPADDDPGITCKFCGEEGLHWEKTQRGYRLFGLDGMHSCLTRGDSNDDDDERPRGVTCEFCGKTGLWWSTDYRGKDVLFGPGGLHECIGTRSR